MTSCSIKWCGNSSRNSSYKTNGITFHRFPNKPHIKEKWIQAARRENWFPSNFSVICSRHFTEDSFINTNYRRRLFDTAIPTQYLPTVVNFLGNLTVIDVKAPEHDSPKPSSSSTQQLLSTTPKSADAEKLRSADPVTPLQYNSPNKKRLCRRILELSGKVTKKNRQIKELRDRVRYFKKKVASLNLIISDLVKK